MVSRRDSPHWKIIPVLRNSGACGYPVQDASGSIGVGAAISSGYIWARDNAYDVTAVMAGDGQMDPLELDRVIGPVADGSANVYAFNRRFARASMVSFANMKKPTNGSAIT